MGSKIFQKVLIFRNFTKNNGILTYKKIYKKKQK